jgi:hypothetical protein
MAKPFRVLRGKKYIGNFKARVKGEIVNLWTKNAEEARRRERRAQKGDFGWRPDAADATKQILDGDDAEPIEEEDSQEVASSEPAAVVPESGPKPTAAGPPSTPPPEPSPPPVDPVAEANAAAAGMAEEFKETLGAAGIDLSDLMNPEFLGGLHVAAQDTIFQFAAPFFTERKPQPFVLPEKFAGAVKVLGNAWVEQLKRWNLSLGGISPGALILLATGGMLAVQIAALYKPEPEATPQGAAGVA